MLPLAVFAYTTQMDPRNFLTPSIYHAEFYKETSSPGDITGLWHTFAKHDLPTAGVTVDGHLNQVTIKMLEYADAAGLIDENYSNCDWISQRRQMQNEGASHSQSQNSK